MTPTYTIRHCSAGWYVRCRDCCVPERVSIHTGPYGHGVENRKFVTRLARKCSPKRGLKR